MPEIKKGFTFAPRESGCSLRDWVGKLRRKRNESFKKKLHKKLARLKIRCTFAPASRNTESVTEA